MKVEIKYPNYRYENSSPTPCNYLVICDKCGNARWTIKTIGIQNYCETNGCKNRMREASKKEYAEAEKFIVYR